MRREIARELDRLDADDRDERGNPPSVEGQLAEAVLGELSACVVESRRELAEARMKWERGADTSDGAGGLEARCTELSAELDELLLVRTKLVEAFTDEMQKAWVGGWRRVFEIE